MNHPTIDSIRQRLTEAGGRMSQDLGLGRIVGQILVFVYLRREACSLDEIGSALELSKPSCSIAARQLERLGMIVRVWRSGDRKSYYRTADNFMDALQKGLVEYFRQKLSAVGLEIEHARQLLEQLDDRADSETTFLVRRVQRASQLKKKADMILTSPFAHFIAKSRTVDREKQKE